MGFRHSAPPARPSDGLQQSGGFASEFPTWLEALQMTLSRIEQGKVSALEAIESLLGDEYTTRESRAGGNADGGADRHPTSSCQSSPPSGCRKRPSASSQSEPGAGKRSMRVPGVPPASVHEFA